MVIKKQLKFRKSPGNKTRKSTRRSEATRFLGERGIDMANIKWIGTQELGKEMEPLLTKYETVFIECEFHTVLMRAIRALKELRLNYRTNLFEEADWLHWDYDNPNKRTISKMR